MGNLLETPVTEKETHCGSTNEGLQFGVSSMQGWRVHMEDAHITETKISARDLSGETVLDLPGHAVFGVFDGHGGSFAAIYSGRNFCRVLCSRQQFFQYASQTSAQRENDPNSLSMLKEALRAAFIDLDLEIACTLKGQHVEGADQSFSLADAGPGSQDTSAQVTEDGEPTLRLIQQESNAGTTACIVLITPTHIICANAGDSRSVLSRNSNMVVPLSFDHKPENEEEEKRIRAAGGYVACGRVDSDLSVSRGLGDFRHKNMGVVMKESIQAGQTSSVQRPEDQKVSPVPDFVIEKRNELHDEFVMIACDGIWDVRSNDEGIKLVADIFEEGETDVGLMCEEVCDECLQLGSKDNMTVLIVRMEAQKIGEGGGVESRRTSRSEAHA